MLHRCAGCCARTFPYKASRMLYARVLGRLHCHGKGTYHPFILSRGPRACHNALVLDISQPPDNPPGNFRHLRLNVQGSLPQDGTTHV